VVIIFSGGVGRGAGPSFGKTTAIVNFFGVSQGPP
jgi:hypothetical protein